MTDNLEASPHKPPRKRVTRNPKRKRQFDDAPSVDDIIGPGEEKADT
jgi:hypothetical protein